MENVTLRARRSPQALSDWLNPHSLGTMPAFGYLVRAFQALKRHKRRACEDRMQEPAIMHAHSMDFWLMWKGNRECGARMNVTLGAWEPHSPALFRVESQPILQLGGVVRVEELDERKTKFESRLSILFDKRVYEILSRCVIGGNYWAV